MLLDEGRASSPPDLETFARKPTIPQKVPNVSIYDKRPGHPIRMPRPGWYVVLARQLARHLSRSILHTKDAS